MMDFLDANEAVQWSLLNSKMTSAVKMILNEMCECGYFTEHVSPTGFHMSKYTLDIHYRMNEDEDVKHIHIPIEQLKTIENMRKYVSQITRQKQDVTWAYTDHDTRIRLRREYMRMKQKPELEHLREFVKLMENRYGLRNLTSENK